jgi:hypothetical protein
METKSYVPAKPRTMLFRGFTDRFKNAEGYAMGRVYQRTMGGERVYP